MEKIKKEIEILKDRINKLKDDSLERGNKDTTFYEGLVLDFNVNKDTNEFIIPNFGDHEGLLIAHDNMYTVNYWAFHEESYYFPIHTHEQAETIIILDGQIYREDTHEMKHKGGVFHIFPNEPHAFLCYPGAKFIIIFTPGIKLNFIENEVTDA